LASSQNSLHNPDWLDVGEIVKAFQEMNKVHITLFGRVEDVHGSQQLTFLITAEEAEYATAEPAVLASVKCHLGSGNHRTMEAAIMWALYQLDWQLASTQSRPEPETA